MSESLHFAIQTISAEDNISGAQQSYQQEIYRFNSTGSFFCKPWTLDLESWTLAV